MQLLQQEIFMVRCSENIMVSQYHTIILIILSVKWPLQKWKQKGFSNKCFILSQNIRHETWNIFLITLIRETVIVRSRILPDQIWWLNRIWTWPNWLDQLRPLCSFSVTASVCGESYHLCFWACSLWVWLAWRVDCGAERVFLSMACCTDDCPQSLQCRHPTQQKRSHNSEMNRSIEKYELLMFSRGKIVPHRCCNCSRNSRSRVNLVSVSEGGVVFRSQ